ncbi:cytochrome-c peroxidase, partial [Acidobacteriia bacterium AH_259_A11_L15]|nr:cytochrome-c peroxidase [Acidobacteriia bacterium AH_259_A11_L15]
MTKTLRSLLFGSALFAVLLAAAQAPEPAAPWRPQIPPGLDLYMPVPEDNPLTAEKVALGRRLFFDPILSRDYSLACASCHDPRHAFVDGLPIAIG